MGVIDLLKVAKHGSGERVFPATFRFAASIATRIAGVGLVVASLIKPMILRL